MRAYSSWIYTVAKKKKIKNTRNPIHKSAKLWNSYARHTYTYSNTHYTVIPNRQPLIIIIVIIIIIVETPKNSKLICCVRSSVRTHTSTFEWVLCALKRDKVREKIIDFSFSRCSWPTWSFFLLSVYQKIQSYMFATQYAQTLTLLSHFLFSNFTICSLPLGIQTNTSTMIFLLFEEKKGISLAKQIAETRKKGTKRQ